MRYLMGVINDTGNLATREETASINVFNDRLQAKGRWPGLT
nr:hypothetical protein [Herbidospora sakaeratensis]